MAKTSKTSPEFPMVLKNIDSVMYMSFITIIKYIIINYCKPIKIFYEYTRSGLRNVKV